MSVKENFYIPDKPIAFNRDFVNFGIGITGALFLSQCVYWSKRTLDNNGWFFKTMQEWEDETGLSRFEQETARKKLKALGLIEEKRAGVPAKLYYKIVANKIVEMLKTSMRECSKLVCGNVANKSEEMSQTLYKDTEITTEITTDINSPIIPLRKSKQKTNSRNEDKKENLPISKKSKKQENKPKLLFDLLEENPNLEKYEKEILDFISYRKTIKKALNTTLPIKAYIQALKDLEALGYSFSFCIQQMKSNEWQTIKVDYIHKNQKATAMINNNQFKTKAQRRNEFIDEYFRQKERLEDNLDIEDVEIIS